MKTKYVALISILVVGLVITSGCTGDEEPQSSGTVDAEPLEEKRAEWEDVNNAVKFMEKLNKDVKGIETGNEIKEIFNLSGKFIFNGTSFKLKILTKGAFSAPSSTVYITEDRNLKVNTEKIEDGYKTVLQLNYDNIRINGKNFELSRGQAFKIIGTDKNKIRVRKV